MSPDAAELPGDEEPPDSSSQIAWLRSLQDREALFQIMDGDRRTVESLEAAEALTGLGDVRGLDHLIATLNDPRSGLRQEAAEILQQLGHPRGLRALETKQAETQSSRRAGEREEAYDDLNGMMKKKGGGEVAKAPPPTSGKGGDAPVQADSGGAKTRSGGRPAWIDGEDPAYPWSRYVYAVGFGRDRTAGDS